MLRRCLLLADDFKILAQNKKARFDYDIEERLEVGMSLEGCEVKSIRSGKASIKEAYVKIEGEELFVVGMHVAPYEHSSFNSDPVRKRKLLAHRRETRRLDGKVREKGFTIVPLRVYVKNGKIKMEIGLAKGKTKYDRRRDIAERDARRDTERYLKWGKSRGR